MHLKKYLFIFSFFAFIAAHAQVNVNTNPFWEGELELTDGTIKKGFIQVPNVGKIKKVIFRASKKGKKESIKRKLVKSVKFVSANGVEYLYEKIATVNTLKGNASIGSSLLMVEAKNDYVTFYIESGAYKVDKKSGEIMLIYRYQQGSDFPTIARYIRKKDREKANMFYVTAYSGGFKRSAKHHLKEDAALLERIVNGELGKKNIPEIIAAYIETTDTL